MIIQKVESVSKSTLRTLLSRPSWRTKICIPTSKKKKSVLRPQYYIENSNK